MLQIYKTDQCNLYFRSNSVEMAERHFDDFDLDMSGDSERLVISLTPFTPLNDHDINQQPEDVTVSQHKEPTVLTVEVYQNGSDVDDDEEGSTAHRTHPNEIPKFQAEDHDTSDVSSSPTPRLSRPSPSFLVENILPSSSDTDFSHQPLPGIETMMTRSGDVTTTFPRDFFPSQHAPPSFWDTPDYNYVLDSDYSSDNSQQPPALSWTSCNVNSGRFDQQFPVTPPVDLSATNVPEIPKTVQKVITSRLNPLTETKPYKRHPKPPYSYAAMSIMAIENSTNKSLMYREITDAIHDMFPEFFGGEYQGWRKSVRHMLSRMKCFTYEKKFDELNNRSCYSWTVDLTKVKPEEFMRQATKENTRKTEHAFMPYLHQQLNQPPVILPERHCDSDTATTPSAVSRAMRDVLLQHQHVDAKKVTDVAPFPLSTPELKTMPSDFDVTLPSKPANYKLSSMSTLAADPDDFLGAKPNNTYSTDTNTNQPSAPTSDVVEKSTVPDFVPYSHVEETIKDLGLPTYILDSPIASPIPHDVYRDTEVPDRHCPSVGLSPSTPATSTKLQTKKRSRPSTGVKPNKKTKKSATYNVTSCEQSPSQTSLAPMFYPPTESATSSYLPPFSIDSVKPLCWPIADNTSISFPPGGVVPSLPFGYLPEQFPWYHQTSYPYQFPVSYGYPTYDSQYGHPSVYGHQQYQNEASRWHRVPYDGALNLSTKPDF